MLALKELLIHQLPEPRQALGATDLTERQQQAAAGAPQPEAAMGMGVGADEREGHRWRSAGPSPAAGRGQGRATAGLARSLSRPADWEGLGGAFPGEPRRFSNGSSARAPAPTAGAAWAAAPRATGPPPARSTSAGSDRRPPDHGDGGHSRLSEMISRSPMTGICSAPCCRVISLHRQMQRWCSSVWLRISSQPQPAPAQPSPLNPPARVSSRSHSGVQRGDRPAGAAAATTQTPALGAGVAGAA